MSDINKRVRRSALRLIAISMLMGFMIGFAVGAVVMYHSIDRTIVIPLTEGIKA